MSLPDWMNTLKVTVLPKPPGSGTRLKGLGIVISIAIAAAAIFALTHTLKNVDYNEVFEVVRHTNSRPHCAGRGAGGHLLRQPDAL